MMVSPTRRPLTGVDPNDLEQVQRFVLQALETELLLWGRVTPRLLLVGSSGVDDLRLDHLGPEVAATFDALSARAGVRHRILRRADVDAGTRSGRAQAFGVVHDERGTWWSAERWFTHLPGRLVAPGGGWTMMWGEEHDALPSSWFGDASGVSPWTVLAAHDPTLRARVEGGEWPSGMPRIAHPVEATNAAASLAEVEAWRDGLEGLAVFVFRGRRVERWHLHDDIPDPYDDVVRAVLAGGPTPDSVAVMRFELFTAGGEPSRAVITVGEAGGVRIQRVLALRYTAEGGDDRPDAMRHWASLPHPIGDDRWIGAAPRTPVRLVIDGSAAEA